MNEPGVCAPPYDLISHEHVPRQLSEVIRPEDLQNKITGHIYSVQRENYKLDYKLRLINYPFKMDLLQQD